MTYFLCNGTGVSQNMRFRVQIGIRGTGHIFCKSVFQIRIYQDDSQSNLAYREAGYPETSLSW